MTITKESTRSLFELWRDSRHLLWAVKAHQAREKLLRREARGMTEPVAVIVIDPRITALETALKKAIPLLKANLENNLFEEWLVGDDPSDGSDMPF